MQYRYIITICAVLAFNLLSFALMGIDKRRARRGKWRIAERTLWLSALPMAAPGAYAGMRAFHHKTRHRSFKFGMPALAVAQLCAAAWTGMRALGW
ncbi:MAG: DUF1294 domain-containing protein [Candidatus Fimadaptatus sp.]|jgi:uncharacterized membrane protein YsdA (DUF1294 family)